MIMGRPDRMFGAETLKPKNVGETLGRLGGYFKPYWPSLIVVAVLIIAGTYTQVRAPELIGQSVDCYLARGGGCWYDTTAADPSVPLSDAERIAGLGVIILQVVGLYVAGALTGGLQFFVMTWAGQKVLRALRTQLFAHLQTLSLGYYSRNEAGAIMSRITNDTDTMQQAIGFALVSVSSGALLIVWILLKMLSLSVGYALLSMLVVPAMLLVTLWLSGEARKAFRVTRVEIGKVNADLQETISGVREVQAFGRERANIAEFREVNAANRDANIRAVSYTAALQPALEALGYVAVGVVTVVGGLALLRGQELFGTAVTLGLVVTFLGYAQRFNQPIAQIATLWTNIQSAIAGAERIFALLDEKPEIVDSPGAVELPPVRGDVEFRDVWSQYKEDEPVLRGVSFRAEPGQTVAVVGPTGAGKTTIINLIPRFWDVTRGEVLVDGQDVRRVTAESLRRQIGIVLQDTFLFSTSVRENIRYGRVDATDEEVEAAARLAHADAFVRRLSQGYDTVLGERGTGLSQGQRQLLAIARAALADPRILILDEATSSVDTRTEREIQRALEELLRGRTSFVIAHRLSTVRHADQVLVLEAGQIVESGTHEALLAQRGVYHELYRRQFLRTDDLVTAS
jgi:ATP-binding cassette subfamily B protein